MRVFSRLLLLTACLACAVLSQPEPSRKVSTVNVDIPVVDPMEVFKVQESRWVAAVNANTTTTTTTQPAQRPEGTTGAQNAQARRSYEPGSIEALICSVFTEDCDRAVRVARCESGLDPYARNPSGAAGLFQLLGHGDLFAARGWDVATDWSDPYKNTVVAHDLWVESGWRPWVCKA